MLRNNKNVTKFHIIKTQNTIDNKIGISDRVVWIILKDAAYASYSQRESDGNQEYYCCCILGMISSRSRFPIEDYY